MFGIWTTIDSLAGGDILKWDAIYELPLNMVMLKLEIMAVSEKYRNSRMEIERQEQINNQRKR